MVNLPRLTTALEEKCIELGFTMPSDRLVGSLLRNLCLSKPGGNFLELGTGIGLSLAWIVDGAIKEASVTSIDNDSLLTDLAVGFFSDHKNVQVICSDGGKWLEEYTGPAFDLIFADAWPGKYSHLDRALSLLATGGFYVIDDMKVQSNWPDGHQQQVNELVSILSKRPDLRVSKLDWSTGVILAVKK